METILAILGLNSILELEAFAFYLVISWVLMIAAVLIDTYTGVSAAKARCELITSKKLRHSISKIKDYWFLQVFGLIIDVFIMIAVHTCYPWATFAVTLGCVLIETKSYIENLHKRKSDAAQVVNILSLCADAMKSKDPSQLVQYIKNTESSEQQIQTETNNQTVEK